MIYPPALNPGDTIGITSTARKINHEELEFAIAEIKAQGYKAVLSSCIGLHGNQMSGTDTQRTNAFQELLDNPKVKAILCARGGYGTVKIIDEIDWRSFVKNPKWICGYSDVTVLHSHIHEKLGSATLHSSMPINFKTNTPKALQSFFNALRGSEIAVNAPPHVLNKTGTAQGVLVGGNLSILYSLLGSESQINTAGKILFIEDLDEYLYHIDRMMMALNRAGMLSNLAGLIIGGMSDMNDNDIPFGQTAEEIIYNAVAKYNYPVAFNFPVGHLDDNRSLVLGGRYKLEVLEDGGSWVEEVRKQITFNE